MILKNCSLNDMNFWKSDKTIIGFGASEFVQTVCSQFSYIGIEKYIRIFADNDKRKQNKTICLNGKSINIVSDTYCFETIKEDAVILITSLVYAYEIYEQLESNNQLNDTECYILSFMLHEMHKEKNKVVYQYTNQNLQPIIPKKIHSFWFSGDKKPELYEKCIKSWQKNCPDYDIIEWNADNYDTDKNLFMKQAMKEKKWAAVSDYARLDVIYQYGGIYMDMDFELIKNLDNVIHNKAFFAFDPLNFIEMGAAFGAVSKMIIIKHMLNRYEQIPFLKDDGGYNLIPQPQHMLSTFKQFGLSVNGEFQLIEDMAFYPKDFFCPLDTNLEILMDTENTIGIHHYGAGWYDAKQYQDKRIRIDGHRKLQKILQQ